MTYRLALCLPCAALVPNLASGQIPGRSPELIPRVRFEDTTAAAGLDVFERRSYLHGGDGLGGAAWFDYNADNLLDLYLLGGTEVAVPGVEGQPNALFENQGDGTFLDVAAEHGAAGGQGNSGVIAADFDNDGDQDLFLTGDGGMLGHAGIGAFPTIDSGCVLLENQGAPDFDYVAVDLAIAGLGSLQTTLSAAAADVNFDGLLDLYVCATGTLPYGCPGPPTCCNGTWDPPTLERSRLFVNTGGGTEIRFAEVSEASAGQSLYGAMAAVFHDSNLDGRPDLFVCNGIINLCEPTPIELFLHGGIGTGGEPVLHNQAALQPNLGQNGAWMGVAVGGFSSTLDPSAPQNELAGLFFSNAGGSMSHAIMEPRFPDLLYVDVGSDSGVGSGTSPSDLFGWGCTAQDFDLDGQTDLFFTGSFLPYGLIGANRGNPGTLMLNEESGPMTDASFAIPDHSERYTSGVAAGDFDGDGRVDLLVVTDAIDASGDPGTPILLRNTTPKPDNWITVRLVGNGIDTNRDAVGARVRVLYGDPANRRAQIQEVLAGSSLLSMDSKWLTFGLGDTPRGAQVEVQVDWPSGPQTPLDPANWTSYGPLDTAQTVTIVQGP